MQSSQALSDLLTEKLESLIVKFTRSSAHVHATLSVEKTRQKLHVSLITADGYDVEAEHIGENMYSEIDNVIEKVKAQLRRHKERLQNHERQSIRSLDSSPELKLLEEFEDSIDAAEVIASEQQSHHGNSQL